MRSKSAKTKQRIVAGKQRPSTANDESMSFGKSECLPHYEPPPPSAGDRSCSPVRAGSMSTSLNMTGDDRCKRRTPSPPPPPHDDSQFSICGNFGRSPDKQPKAPGSLLARSIPCPKQSSSSFQRQRRGSSTKRISCPPQPATRCPPSRGPPPCSKSPSRKPCGGSSTTSLQTGGSQLSIVVEGFKPAFTSTPAQRGNCGYGKSWNETQSVGSGASTISITLVSKTSRDSSCERRSPSNRRDWDVRPDSNIGRRQQRRCEPMGSTPKRTRRQTCPGNPRQLNFDDGEEMDDDPCEGGAERQLESMIQPPFVSARNRCPPHRAPSSQDTRRRQGAPCIGGGARESERRQRKCVQGPRDQWGGPSDANKVIVHKFTRKRIPAPVERGSGVFGGEERGQRTSRRYPSSRPPDHPECFPGYRN